MPDILEDEHKALENTTAFLFSLDVCSFFKPTSFVTPGIFPAMKIFILISLLDMFSLFLQKVMCLENITIQ